MELLGTLVARPAMSVVTHTGGDVPPDDAELVRQLGDGDTRAAQILYQRHVKALLRFAVAIGGCQQSAEDAVHDTFIELLRHPARFDPRRGSLGAYLFAIARHRMARFARSARRHVELDLEEGDADSAEPVNHARAALTTEDEAERVHAIAQVRTAILALPLMQREVIALCDLEELPYADVALVLNCPVGTVRSRLHRARAQLARELAALQTQPSTSIAAEVPAPAALLTCRGTLT